MHDNTTMPTLDRQVGDGVENTSTSSGNASKSRTSAKNVSPKAILVNSHPNLDLKKLEKLWANDYHEKPNDQREQLLNELHGASSRAVPESPAMINSALNSFQEAIDRTVPEEEKMAYYRACFLNSTYIHSVAYRLKFLRAELFDSQKAALRYVRNLNYLRQNFGDFALMRQLYMSDLNIEEKKFLKMGYIQILPFRDTVGRRIVAVLGSFGGLDFPMMTRERVSAYLNFAVLSEDETTQRMGAISLGLLSEDSIDLTRSVKLSNIARFTAAMPIRFSGYHTCLPNSFRAWIIKALLMTFIQGEARLLTRIHVGTQIECEYKLRSFGIPTENIPQSSTGTIKNGYHKTLLKITSVLDSHRKAKACNDYCRYYSPGFITTPFPAIVCPEANSFLVRRNGVAWNYPGNIRVREFLEEKLADRRRLEEDYVSCITKEFISMNTPILIFDDMHGWYKRITRKEEIQKQIVYIMRELRKRKRMRKNYTSNVSVANEFQNFDEEGSNELGACFLCDNDTPSERRKKLGYQG